MNTTTAGARSGAGVVLYVGAWLLMPADGEDQSVAQARIAARRHRIPKPAR